MVFVKDHTWVNYGYLKSDRACQSDNPVGLKVRSWGLSHHSKGRTRGEANQTGTPNSLQAPARSTLHGDFSQIITIRYYGK
jgi:hypothetical protein